jgi:hypothetical protein
MSATATALVIENGIDRTDLRCCFVDLIEIFHNRNFVRQGDTETFKIQSRDAFYRRCRISDPECYINPVVTRRRKRLIVHHWA